ncbi:hypothetical protein ACXR2U_12815 [Jatrophihabitans sp. YIM 134969]
MTGTRTEEPTPAERGLSRRSRVSRLVAAGAVLALLTTGTLVGQDHDFPFGPFRMYATRDDPDGAVIQAVVLARTADGRTVDVTDTAGAPRRAELEGRLSTFEHDPASFAPLGPAYVHAARGVVEVTLVRREFRLHDGRRAATVDVRLATWQAP